MAKTTGATSHMWTKAEIRKVLTLWEAKSIEDLAKELDVNPQQITYIVAVLRKEGFDLPKKKRPSVINNLLLELKKEYGI